MPALNSNASRPMPRADTGSVLLNWLSDTSTFLLHLERRFDPFFRPAFDAVLRTRTVLGCAFPDRVLTLRRISTMWAS
jgi:hypothetical protein